MSPRERTSAIVRHLAFEPGHYFLGGSAGLALRDLRHVGDLDVGVTTRYWMRLAQCGDWGWWTPEPGSPRRSCDPPYLTCEVDGTAVHVFSSWRRRAADETEFNDFNRVFADGIEFVAGWPCLKLEILLRQKVDAIVNAMRDGLTPRPKDVIDVRRITHFLEGR